MTTPPDRSTLSTILAEVGRGTADTDAADAIHDVVRAVGETGKAGSVTVTVKITPPKGGGTYLEVAAEVTTKVPRLEPVPSIYFRDPTTGDLTRNDPDQHTFDIRTGEIR